MAVTSLVPLIIIIIHLFLLCPAYCLSYKPHWNTFENIVVEEEKTRLGSTPPSCHNKCNQCHPCMAVQMPTVPNHNGIQPAAAAAQSRPLYYFESSPGASSSAGNRYSNYKPLGWKCRCDGHFYNP
ncbi:EPIDERMAL PATTERNING FACTOR-like protein 1 [Henckelia pumila]|uniref:EPIDERMAL PATTERNING FACTOR-like protein 1 n=1 Tax=Henckelia pumila TaxID=405737 RepID=UPI003C6E3119